jgi:hypothetical protein
MTQANAGIGFDLIWQTAQWRQQLDAAQADLQAMASNVSQLQIMIPVVMEDRLTMQVDALIAEIEATRSINIPVNIVGGGASGGTGGFGGGSSPASVADSSIPFVLPPYQTRSFARAVESGELTGIQREANAIYANPSADTLAVNGFGTAESMMAGGTGAAAAAAGGGSLAKMLPGLGLAFMAFRGIREAGRDARNYDEAMYMMAQANNMTPGNAQEEVYLKVAEKQQSMYGGFFGGLARIGQDFLPSQGDSSADSIDESVVTMQGNIRTRRWQEQQIRQRIRDADVNDVGFTNRLGKEFQFDPDFREIAKEGVTEITKRRNSEYSREEKERDRESERLFNEQERALREAERQKERDARLDSSSERRIGDVAGRSAESGLRSDGLSVAAGRDELLRSNRDQVAAIREMAAATDDLKEKTRLLNEAQAEESAGTQRVSAYDNEASRAHRERIQSIQDETQQMTLRTSNRTDEAQMLQATKRDNEDIAQTQERIANAKKRLADTDNDFSEETDENGKVIERYIGSGTSAQGAAEAQERRSLNEGLGEDQDTLGAQAQHREASTAQVRKEQQQHLTDMATETAANEARAHGSNQEADFIELQARVRKEISDAPASEREQTRKLATSQLDRFIHGESKPFMGSMDQFGDDLQMQVLQNDPHAIAQAQAMKKQINDPVGALGGIAKGIGSMLGIGGDDKGHHDPHEKTKSAGEKLESAAEKLLAAAVKFGGITIMEAF